jgi:hypothetical protein
VVAEGRGWGRQVWHVGRGQIQWNMYGDEGGGISVVVVVLAVVDAGEDGA